MRKLSLLLFSLSILFPTHAQNFPNQPVIRASVDVVHVPCTVRDGAGNYITGLQKNDFEILEDGTPQEIGFFSQTTDEDAQPLTIVLLIDTSGSVKNKLEFEQLAATEFLVQTLRKNKDMAAVVQFDSEIQLVQDFTYDQSTLERAIFQIRAGGATKLYDAIWVSVDELIRPEIGRKVLVILSDGADTQSVTEEEEAIRIAQEEDVVIYAVGVKSRRMGSDFGTLEDFARSTGGRFFDSEANLEKLREAFSRINQEIKHQYSLGYVSSNQRRDGSFREIEVNVKRRGLKVTHRKGYYAPEDKS